MSSREDKEITLRFMLTDRERAALSMRRRGNSYDQIAEELDYEDKFEVIDELNSVYARLNNQPGRSYKPDVREVIDFVDSKIDDLITIFHQKAVDNEDLKAAKFVLDASKVKATIHGAISPSQVNIQVNGLKPWETVYQATLSEDYTNENVIEGSVVGELD